MCRLENPENKEFLHVDAVGFRKDYVAEVESFRNTYREFCFKSGVDYVPLDTSMPFDQALLQYLLKRRLRG
jgi:hypothetical protein